MGFARRLYVLATVLFFSRTLASAFASDSQNHDPPRTCGAYKGTACDEILMSTVLTETTGMFCLRCVVAAALGGVIGAQREFSPYIGMFLSRTKNTAVAPVRRAGLRTHVLVALGACLFTEASWSAFAVPVPAQIQQSSSDGNLLSFVAGTFNYDTSRVAAQVVSGVGFLGAGTIWRSSFGGTSGGARDEVYGLTTAASLWATAAVGMHVGGANRKDNYYLGPTFATFLIVVTLQVLVHVEVWVHAKAFARTSTKITANVTLAVLPPATDSLSETYVVRKHRPSEALENLVTVVTEKVGRVVSVGATVTRSTEHPAASTISCSLVVIVCAAGGSLDLMDAILGFGDEFYVVSELTVDNCGAQRKDQRKGNENEQTVSDTETLDEPLLRSSNGTHT